jgi:hypothetical protein
VIALASMNRKQYGHGFICAPIYLPFPECFVIRWIRRSIPDLNVCLHFGQVTEPAIYLPLQIRA